LVDGCKVDAEDVVVGEKRRETKTKKQEYPAPVRAAPLS
jgi:hypothetical protein